MTDKTIWGGTRLLGGCRDKGEKVAHFTKEVRRVQRDVSLASMRLGVLRAKVQSLGMPAENLEPQQCAQLVRISTDFRSTVRENCTVCQTGMGECMVQALIRNSGQDEE